MTLDYTHITESLDSITPIGAVLALLEVIVITRDQVALGRSP